MQKNIKNTGAIKIFQSKNWEISLDIKFEKENIWLTQKQIAEIFWIDRTVVTKHIWNIFKDDEVDEKSNVQFLHIANSDKPVKFYSLDIILSVWYKTDSASAIYFRKWANNILKKYLLKWYSVNQKRLKEKWANWLEELEKTLSIFKNTLKNPELTKDEAFFGLKQKILSIFIYPIFS